MRSELRDWLTRPFLGSPRRGSVATLYATLSNGTIFLHFDRFPLFPHMFNFNVYLGPNSQLEIQFPFPVLFALLIAFPSLPSWLPLPLRQVVCDQNLIKSVHFLSRLFPVASLAIF